MFIRKKKLEKIIDERVRGLVDARAKMHELRFEERMQRLDQWEKAFESDCHEEIDRIRKIYVDNYNETIKANKAHHKLIEGWLKELKDFMVKHTAPVSKEGE